MDDEQQRQVMTDESLDRELAALLQAEVPPDFTARARARVAAQPLAGRWWLTGRWVAAVASIAVIVAGAALWFGRTAPPAVADRPSSPPVAQSVVEPAPSVQTDGRAATPPQQRPVEVLISPAESAIVQRLLMAARGASPNSDASPADEASALDPPMPIVIDPISVAPLVTADIEVGAQQ